MILNRTFVNREPSGVNRDSFTLVGKHYPTLDGLRGLAILAVLIYHFTDQFHDQTLCTTDKTFLLICQAGWVGVDLFFVLSGFLITGILLDTQRSGNYFKAFYGRRVLRIFPAYYATLAVFFLVLPALQYKLPPAFGNLVETMSAYQVWFWTYLTNWLFAFEGTFTSIPGGYFWSLAVEEQFYLAWPIVVFWLRPHHLLRVTLFLIPATLILRLVLLNLGASPSTVYAATFTHMDGLLAGAALAILLRSYTTLNRNRPAPARPTRSEPAAEEQTDQTDTVAPVAFAHSRLYLTVKWIGLLSMACLLTIGIVQGHFRFWDYWVAAYGFSLLALAFSYILILAVTATESSWTGRLFTKKVLRSFGRYSYVIYLLHVPIGLLLEKAVFSPQNYPLYGSILPATIAFLLLATSVSWITGFLSWNLFEKHFLKLKRFFSYEPNSLASKNG